MEQRLTFVELIGGKSPDGHLLARYRCVCGNETITAHSRVKRGFTRSCGCLAAENKPNLKHGMRKTREYGVWQGMLTRCHNPNSRDYERYGGAGIRVCDEWRTSFDAFFAHVGPRPEGTTIDRVDGSRGYEPGNVRWATTSVQARNKRSLVIVNTPAGRMPLVDYAQQIGLTRGAAHLRLKRGKLDGVSLDV